MAYKESIGLEMRAAYHGVEHMWLIAGSVGWGNYNFYDDVALVQYLINKCAGKKVLETDGIFGQKTWKAIKKFQDSVNKYTTFSCRVDGRISDKVFNERAFTTRGESYTIDMLNWLFYREKRIYFDDLRRDPDLPSELIYICTEFE